MTYPNARDCEHGRQRGKCVDCDLKEATADRDRIKAENERLRCTGIRCHMGRDILDSLSEAIMQTPACTLNAILCAAMQEIQWLRGEIKGLGNGR